MFSIFFSFFFNATATTEIYTLSLHDALPILPEPDFPAGGCQQEVEVALEVPLAVVRDEDPVSRLGPDDVVPEMDVVGVRGADAIGRGLEERVVDDLVRRGLR